MPTKEEQVKDEFEIFLSDIKLDDIKKSVDEINKIRQNQIFFYGDVAVVAIKTEPIYFHSENIKIFEMVKKRVLEFGFREIYVTKDIDIFRKISEIGTCKSSLELLNLKRNIVNIMKEREDKILYEKRK